MIDIVNTSVYYPNFGDNNSNLLLTASNILITMVLCLVTWWYAHHIKKNDDRERITREMDSLISPLYVNKKSKFIFLNGRPCHMTNPSINTDHDNFWENINKNKYLAPTSLRVCLNKYLEVKSSKCRSDVEPSAEYDRIEKELFLQIDKRYEELQLRIDNFDQSYLKKLLNKIQIKK